MIGDKLTGGDNRPLTSVAILMHTFNSVLYLGEAIQSILDQSYSNFTLYILDGGSADATVAVAEAFAKKDNRIVVKLLPGTKPATRTNMIIKDIDEDLIVIANSDDVNIPDRIAIQRDFMVRNPDCYASGASTHYWMHSKRFVNVDHYHGFHRYPSMVQNIQSRLPFWWCFSTPSLVFNRRLIIEKSLYFDEGLDVGSDWLWYWRVSRVGRIDNISDVVLSYRIHSKSDGFSNLDKIFNETRLIRTIIAKDAGFWDLLDQLERDAFLALIVEHDRVIHTLPGFDYHFLFLKLISINESIGTFSRSFLCAALDDYVCSHDAVTQNKERFSKIDEQLAAFSARRYRQPELFASPNAKSELQEFKELASVGTRMDKVTELNSETSKLLSDTYSIVQAGSVRLSKARGLKRRLKRMLLALRPKSRKPRYFDEEWYLKSYVDVERAGIDAYRHYIRFGLAEGRDPNAFFSSDWYVAEYPDVAASGMVAFSHFVEYGLTEGRKPHPRYDAKAFIARYGTIKRL